jgi:hypothetical protein
MRECVGQIAGIRLENGGQGQAVVNRVVDKWGSVAIYSIESPPF